MSKLHVFDMDGTLIKGSACLAISEHVGELEKVLLLEERWAKCEIGHVEYYELCLPLWKGLTEEVLEKCFQSSVWIDGVTEVFDDICQRGETIAVITLSPNFFVEKIKRWGAHHTFGAIVEPGVPPKPELVLTPETKPKIIHQLAKEMGISLDDCVAYGDSSSDEPLFKLLEHSVAMNASESLRTISRRQYDGWDLREAYELSRQMLDHE
jgi:phosphoserine phosphatase